MLEYSTTENNMIHDNIEDRKEFTAFLKRHKLYNIMTSRDEMVKMHTIYWTLIDEMGTAGICL